MRRSLVTKAKSDVGDRLLQIIAEINSGPLSYFCFDFLVGSGVFPLPAYAQVPKYPMQKCRNAVCAMLEVDCRYVVNV